MARLPLIAVALSLAGVAVSIYLTVLHYQGAVPACPVSGPINCDAVLTSKYAVVAGSAIPTSALGIAWFAVSAALWARPPTWLHVVWSAVGVLAVLGLVFVEIVLIGAICLWCTATHILVVAIALIAISVRR